MTRNMDQFSRCTKAWGSQRHYEVDIVHDGPPITNCRRSPILSRSKIFDANVESIASISHIGDPRRTACLHRVVITDTRTLEIQGDK